MAKSDNRRPNQARSKSQVARDRKIIAELYLKGQSQAQMEKVIGVDQTTISADLKAIAEDWRKSGLMDMNEAKQRELLRLDMAEREAWAAWDASKGKKKESHTRAKGTPPKPDGKVKDKAEAKAGPDPVERMTVTETERSIREWESEGNPKFLDAIIKCITKRCEILGVDAPIRVDVPGFELTAQTPKPILRRVAAGMAINIAYAEYAAGINADKYGKE